ncbi:DUF4913 domain-containing protein [Kitasatospora herbaricolor]|uniref:DUF4913 domain-containing protein n=1 Tax=Kitasatospora herbaricolor TaxID=68217 RepID=UPI0036D90EC1
MSAPIPGAPEPESIRLPHGDLDDLVSALHATMAEVRQHGVILAMGGAQYEAELAELSLRVTHILLPVHGREIGSIRPWCAKWHEHPEAVARLHGLWLARQQLAGAEAGLAAPSTWHRDHLDHTFLQLRAPAGPFAACTTSPGRPADRR